MQLNSDELKHLLEGLIFLISEEIKQNKNIDEKLKLRDRLIKQIDFKVKYEKENEGKLTGFVEIDYPNIP